MTDYTRAELEEFWDSWLEVNREAERIGDWRIMAEHYAVDATYGWMYAPDEHFMAVGRDQIRDWAIGIEMDGFDGWHYDYQVTMIDEVKSMVLGFWKQRSGIINDETGEEYEILGIGGSWFGVERQVGGADDGLIKFSWQRDWFDLGNAAALFIELMEKGMLSEGMTKRMTRRMAVGENGLYPVHKAPVGIWDIPE